MDPCKFTEQEMTEDLLGDENGLLYGYCRLLREADSQQLRSEVMRVYTESQQLQFELLHLCKMRAWYRGKNARLQDVAKTLEWIAAGDD